MGLYTSTDSRPGETMLALLLCIIDHIDCESGFSYYRTGGCWKQKPCFPASPSLPWSSMCRATWRTLTTKITGKTKRFAASSRLWAPCIWDKWIIKTPLSTGSPKVLEFQSRPGWSATSAGMFPVFLAVLPGFAIDWMWIHLSIVMHHKCEEEF